MKLFHIAIPNSPDLLKAKATAYWMREGEYPTPADVESFVSGTRAKPGVRLNVLSGLRAFALADAQPFTTWVGLFFGVIALFFSAIAGPSIITTIVVLAAGAILFIFLVSVAGLSFGMDQRKRFAAVWLAAYEDGIRAEEG